MAKKRKTKKPLLRRIGNLLKIAHAALLAIALLVLFTSKDAQGRQAAIVLIVLLGLLYAWRFRHKLKRAPKQAKGGHDAPSQPTPTAAPAAVRPTPPAPAPRAPIAPDPAPVAPDTTPRIIPLAEQHPDKYAAYRYDDVKIAMADKMIEDFSAISVGDAVTLKPEPTNTYDPGAIQLWSGDQLLGYMYKGKLQTMAHDFLKRNDTVLGQISHIDTDKRTVAYELVYFRDNPPAYTRTPLATGKLTASSGEEAQDNIYLCSPGDELDIEYDFEKERYEAHGVGYVGCLPKKLEAYADSTTFKVEEIDETDSGKLFIIVGAYRTH